MMNKKEAVQLLRERTTQAKRDMKPICLSITEAEEITKALTRSAKRQKQDSPQLFEPPLVFPYQSDRFLTAWTYWKKYKLKEFKFAYRSTMSEQAALKELSEIARDEADAIEIIRQSIVNGWKGLFKIKATKRNDERLNHIERASLALNTNI